MVLKEGLKAFDESLLDRQPELRKFLKPNDHYPELMNIQKKITPRVPFGSLNTRVIINEGEVVERIYMTPDGKAFSLFSKSSNTYIDRAA